MNDLSKYKRKDMNLLGNDDPINRGVSYTSALKAKKKKEKKYVDSICFNLTAEEAKIINDLHEETQIPKSTIIRMNLKKAGLFK